MNDKQLLEKIGKQMKMVRAYNNLSITKLAPILDLPVSLLAYYEKGQRRQPITVIQRFCDEFNIKLSDFFNFDENMKIIKISK